VLVGDVGELNLSLLQAAANTHKPSRIGRIRNSLHVRNGAYPEGWCPGLEFTR